MKKARSCLKWRSWPKICRTEPLNEPNHLPTGSAPRVVTCSRVEAPLHLASPGSLTISVSEIKLDASQTETRCPA